MRSCRGVSPCSGNPKAWTYSVRAPTISGLPAVASETTHEKLFEYRQLQTASSGVGGKVSEA
jgi:uncharacterized membrane protein